MGCLSFKTDKTTHHNPYVFMTRLQKMREDKHITLNSKLSSAKLSFAKLLKDT